VTVGEDDAADMVIKGDSDVDSVDVPDEEIELVGIKDGVEIVDAETLTVDDLEDTNDAEAMVEGELETLGLAVDVVVVDCELLVDGDFELTVERDAEGQDVPESVRLFEAL